MDTVLIVDDTILYRTVLREVVAQIPDCRVAATAVNGQAALDRLAQEPVDLVLLDVEMPVMGGLEALDAIRQRYPNTGVIMISGVNKNAASITIQALQRGAIEFIPKPEASDANASKRVLLDALTEAIEAFRQNRRGHRAAVAPITRTAPTVLAPVVPAVARLRNRVDAVVIGVSTGGPNALTQVVPKLPRDLGVPVLVVQHMPPVFTASLAQTLERQAHVTVCEAQDGDAILPNHVYIAPGGKHMVIRRGHSGQGAGDLTVGTNENPPEHNCRPSVNVLFRSAANQFGGNVLAVMMTGMGSDGKEGTKSIKDRGGYCITQDAESCVVYGMPRAIVEAGLSDEVVELNGIADRIAGIVKRSRNQEVG